ncbi:SusD/RagB family nutrient-binding outer membrane lipoprotein [Flavihumibacter stibioxidans]|nr:SusD/RagB family nutrient-binding outer membrane lipoprotein [Flavihumibacter stibioxidans]
MKRLINTYTFLLAATASLLLGGCSKKIDEAFLNPNASVRVPIEQILPGVIGNFVGSSSAAGSSYGTAYDGLYVGRYVQFWATNTSGSQYDQMGGVTGASDLLGSVWAMHYYGMGQNLNKIIEWGTEEEKWDYVGVGLAIRAWSMLTLTNMYGEAPVRDAFNTSKLTFNYDEQPLIYDTVRSIARQAVTYLERTDGNVGKGNLAIADAFFNGGDVNKWKKFAYAVIARSFNHLTNKSSYNADSVVKYCDLAMNTNAENAVAKFANTGIAGTSNFFGPIRSNVGTLRQTAFAANLVTGKNSMFTGAYDPRAHYLLREDSTGEITGIVPNKGSSGLPAKNLPFGFWGSGFAVTAAPSSDASARYLFKNGSPFPIITASEIKFIKAEALLRKGSKTEALQAYRQGIELSIDMLRDNYPQAIPAGKEITETSKNEFLANPVVVPAAEDLTLSHIMLQKYIALYGYGFMETWVDMRRYHYIDNDPVTGTQVYADLTVPSGIDLFVNNNGKLVYRARPRYNSEYIYNVDELQRIGALELDYHTKEQWFTIPQ